MMRRRVRIAVVGSGGGAVEELDGDASDLMGIFCNGEAIVAFCVYVCRTGVGGGLEVML